MTTAVQRRRGTTGQHSAFTGLEGEITVDTTKDTIVVHDGSTAGGIPLAKENLTNTTVSSLGSLTGSQTADDDQFLVFDTSTSTMKKISRAELNNAIEQDALASVTITGGTINGVQIGNTTAATILNVDNLRLDGNTISSTDTNGNIVLAPNGTGDVQLDADTVRIGDSNANATLTTNGTGDLILNTNSGTNSGSITIQDGVDGNIVIAPNGNGQVQITNAVIDTTTIEVTNIKAKDGTASMTIADSTGTVTYSAPAVFTAGTVSAPAITTTGDTNTGIFFPAADTIAFAEGGAEAMRIDSDGDVGIGTNAPAAKLHITDSGNTTADGIRLTLGSEARDHNIYSSIASGRDLLIAPWRSLTIQTGSGFAEGVLALNGYEYTTFGTGSSSTERMRIDSSGNVGIGTTTPDGKIHVVGTTKSYSIFGSADSFTDPYGSFAAQDASAIQSVSTGTSGGSQLQLGWSGTSSGGFAGSVQFMTTGTSASEKRAAIIGCELTASSATNVTGALAFYTTNAGTIAERMRINSSGNVGIGTSSPTRLLQINGSSGVPIVNFNGYDVLSWDNSVQLNFGGITASQWTALKFYTGGSERMRIDSSGNVGIGTSSPTVKLDVSGQISSSGGIAFSGALASGTGVASSGANGDLRFYANGIQYVTLNTSGNVGIGTTAPNTTLSIVGNHTSGQGTLKIQTVTSFASGGLSSIALDDSDGTRKGFIYQDSGGLKIETAASLPVLFYPAGNERARITSDGALLINKTSQVGNASAGFQMQLPNATGGHYGFLVRNSADNKNVIGCQNDGTLFSDFVYDTTTSDAANVNISTSQILRRSTSSIKYKTQVENIEENRSQAIFNLRPVWYRSLCKSDNANWSWYGLIAEEVAEIEPRLVHWGYSEEDYEVIETQEEVQKERTVTGKDGVDTVETYTETETKQSKQLKADAQLKPDGVQYDRLTVLLLDIVKRQDKRIEALEAEVAAMKAK